MLRKSRQNSAILKSSRLPRGKSEEYKTWSSCCSRCTQHTWLSRVTRPITLSPTRGRNRWKHGEDCRNDKSRRQEEETQTCCERSFLPGRCSLSELQAGIERWESHVSRHEKKLKDKLDDEIKLAGLEAVAFEELEKQLDTQLETLANVRGCAPGNRDVR